MDNNQLLNEHLQLLQDYAKLKFEQQQLNDKLSLYNKYEEFYKRCMTFDEVKDASPDVVDELKKIPNAYKELIIQYIEQVTHWLVKNWYKMADKIEHIIFMEWAIVGAKDVIGAMKKTIHTQKANFSPITRQEITPKTKKLQKVKSTIERKKK